MRPKVGKSYIAVSADGDLEGQWTFIIVAEVQQNGDSFYIGLMDSPSNLAAHLFTAEGRSIDTSEFALGFVLRAASRQRAKWIVSDCIGLS